MYYAARVYYAYAIPTDAQTTVQGYLSRFGSGSGNYSTAGTASGGVVCVNTDVDNPQNAVDNDLTNYAQFSSLATVACPSTLRVKLEGTSPAGYFAGFVLGGAGLLDASALAGLRLRTSLNGVPQESAIGLDALQLTVLPNGKTQVSFRTTLPFDAVTIERVGAVSALDNLQIYYGFGVEPRTFQGSTSVLSNFSTPSGHFRTSADAALCVNCAVTNPQNAANAPTDATSYATMNVPVGVLSALGLRLDLTSPGQAGNRAGMVLSPGTGLLDLAALQQLTLNTYDAAGNLLESHSGASLLRVSVLPDGRQEVYFNTTRPFASVELKIGSGIAALANTKVFYAFADDQPTGFPSLITPPAPLPVCNSPPSRPNGPKAAPSSPGKPPLKAPVATSPWSGRPGPKRLFKQWAPWRRRAAARPPTPTCCAMPKLPTSTRPRSTTACVRWIQTVNSPSRRWWPLRWAPTVLAYFLTLAPPPSPSR